MYKFYIKKYEGDNCYKTEVQLIQEGKIGEAVKYKSIYKYDNGISTTKYYKSYKEFLYSLIELNIFEYDDKREIHIAFDSYVIYKNDGYYIFSNLIRPKSDYTTIFDECILETQDINELVDKVVLELHIEEEEEEEDEEDESDKREWYNR